MKVFAFRSIRTRIVTTTALFIVALVSAVVCLWAKSESDLYREQKLNEAKSFAKLLSVSVSRELSQKNWSHIRLNLDLLLKENDDFVYILVSDTQSGNQIVAATPKDFQEQYVPDVVPVGVTETALTLSKGYLAQETFALRNVEFPQGQVRAKRGEQLLEVTSDLSLLSGEKLGTLRIGISLRQVDRAVAHAITQALLVGVLGLSAGLLGAYILASQLSNPVRRLQISAAKIAAGDLEHRADIHLADEIGALAASFNNMSAALQAAFGKLQKTVEAFKRFVPDKFLSIIATDGIENIQVGVGSIRTITILFCDIRGYTSMSEQMTPLETFAFLNDYLECMGQAIDKYGGFIDKYIGDAIMALFDDESTDGVLHAAIAMQHSLIEFNQDRQPLGLPSIAVGIGIHRGEVVMGTVGFSSRIDSTAIGDAVNLASRVEQLTKTYGCSILVTEQVIAALKNPEAFQLRLVDKLVKVKGKDEPIAIYELITH